MGCDLMWRFCKDWRHQGAIKVPPLFGLWIIRDCQYVFWTSFENKNIGLDVLNAQLSAM
jgi:hypothetical protein